MEKEIIIFYTIVYTNVAGDIYCLIVKLGIRFPFCSEKSKLV
jgi:hypothetical protein